jgi:hypothetical protein
VPARRTAGEPSCSCLGEVHHAAALRGGHGHGWSPEWRVGLHGIGSWTKQWQEGFAQPLGQLHSEQRIRQPVLPDVWQQNHSPPVLQPSGQPPACWQVLHGKAVGCRLSQSGPMPTQGLQGPPPQPTQPVTEPIETPVRVRKRPAPSDPAVTNLKNCLRDERRASRLAVFVVTSTATR